MNNHIFSLYLLSKTGLGFISPSATVDSDIAKGSFSELPAYALRKVKHTANKRAFLLSGEFYPFGHVKLIPSNIHQVKSVNNNGPLMLD